MSEVLYYYAQLNENDICFGFEVKGRKYTKQDQPSKLVYLEDYNPGLMYKKWDRELRAWSSERYEPDTNFELLEKINVLEEENGQLLSQVSGLELTLQNVNATSETLIQSIAELTAMIAMLQTP